MKSVRERMLRGRCEGRGHRAARNKPVTPLLLSSSPPAGKQTSRPMTVLPETTHHMCLTYHFLHDGRYLVVLPI